LRLKSDLQILNCHDITKQMTWQVIFDTSNYHKFWNFCFSSINSQYASIYVASGTRTTLQLLLLFGIPSIIVVGLGVRHVNLTPWRLHKEMVDIVWW